MVLQCPECSEQRAYGRAELLGQLAVCPGCEAVFSWQEAEGDRTAPPEAQAAPSGARGSGAGRRRGSGAGGKRRDD